MWRVSSDRKMTINLTRRLALLTLILLGVLFLIQVLRAMEKLAVVAFLGAQSRRMTASMRRGAVVLVALALSLMPNSYGTGHFTTRASFNLISGWPTPQATEHSIS